MFEGKYFVFEISKFKLLFVINRCQFKISFIFPILKPKTSSHSLTSFQMQNFMSQQDCLQPSRANRIMRNYFNASIVDSIQSSNSRVQEFSNVLSAFHWHGISHISMKFIFASPIWGPKCFTIFCGLTEAFCQFCIDSQTKILRLNNWIHESWLMNEDWRHSTSIMKPRSREKRRKLLSSPGGHRLKLNKCKRKNVVRNLINMIRRDFFTSAFGNWNFVSMCAFAI